MSTQPDLRLAETGDAPRLRELVESSMTSSYALSPQDIDTILEAVFDEETLRSRIDDSDAVVVLAELDGVVAGVIEASLTDAGDGEIRWLHVDPERRGAGVGTALFERIRSELDDRDVEHPRAVTLAANTSAGAFLERFGFEQADERTAEIGGRETVEYVYVDGDSAESAADETGSKGGDEGTRTEYPDTVTVGDGTEVHLGADPFRGTEGLFVPSFTDSELSEQYGYYCLNCDSGDVSMDDMERVRCGNCGNTRKPDDDYDGAYL